MGKKIAILGLGAMGSRMAHNLLKSEHEVVVYNRSAGPAEALEKEGAARAGTPREAAKIADIVIAMVTDDAASRAVWLDDTTGAFHGLRPGSIAIESSTLTLSWLQELTEKVSSRSVGFLDAPVVGSRPQAEAGELIHLVGGSDEILDTVRDTLSILGGAIHHVGPVGTGMAMKLAVNAFFGIQVAALGEILGLTGKLGIDRTTTAELFGSLPITSPALKGIAGLMGARSFAPLFPIDLVEKDFRYIVESAVRVQASTPTALAVRDVYSRAKDAGYGGDNIAGVAQLFD